MNGLTSTLPAPGTGYGNDPNRWWKDPLSDLLEGATGAIEGALDLDTDPAPLAPLEPVRASIVPRELQTPLLIGGALAIGWLLLRG